MEKQLKDIIEQYKKSDTTLESYQAISSFVEVIDQNEEFKTYMDKTNKKTICELKSLNADKGDYSKKWNQYRDKKHKSLIELDTWIQCQDLYHISAGIKPDALQDNSDWLFALSGPHDPMNESSKKDLLKKLEITLRNYTPFIKSEVIEDISNADVREVDLSKLKYKSFDINTGILTIGDFEINISKTQYVTIDFELLAYICIDNVKYIEEESYYKNIFTKRLEQEYNPDNEADVRKFADSANSINKKIEKETNSLITKFLIANFRKDGYVKINPKYL